jgi:16S rRNA processing protein RimM
MSTVSGTPPAAQWIAIASLIRPQGRRGELLAEPLSDLPEIFAAGREVHLGSTGATAPAADSSALALEDHWFPSGKNAGRVVLKLSRCDSISQAEALTGRQLLIQTNSLPKLADDTYYVGDLLNCDLLDGPRRVGRIVDVEFATAPDGRTRLQDAAPLLAVEPAPGAEPVLVPFIRAWIDTVDLAGHRLVMHLPAGLFDDATEETSAPSAKPPRPPRPPR